MNNEGAPETSDIYEGIKKAQTWEELQDAVDKHETIRGTSYFFLPKELKDLFDRIRDGVLSNIEKIPRTGDLRNKVIELVNNERVAKGLEPLK